MFLMCSGAQFGNNSFPPQEKWPQASQQVLCGNICVQSLTLTVLQRPVHPLRLLREAD